MLGRSESGQLTAKAVEISMPSGCGVNDPFFHVVAACVFSECTRPRHLVAPVLLSSSTLRVLAFFLPVDEYRGEGGSRMSFFFALGLGSNLGKLTRGSVCQGHRQITQHGNLLSL